MPRPGIDDPVELQTIELDCSTAQPVELPPRLAEIDGTLIRFMKNTHGPMTRAEAVRRIQREEDVIHTIDWFWFNGDMYAGGRIEHGPDIGGSITLTGTNAPEGEALDQLCAAPPMAIRIGATHSEHQLMEASDVLHELSVRDRLPPDVHLAFDFDFESNGIVIQSNDLDAAAPFIAEVLEHVQVRVVDIEHRDFPARSSLLPVPTPSS
ncbi:MAG: hypothetical protein ACR2P0_15580 [Acidimicrobiales bacterium]